MKEKKKILFIFPRGEAVKNFVQSGTTDILRKKYQLIFISVVPNEEIRALLIKSCDKFYELKEIKENYLVGWIRQELNIIHGRWLWSGAAQLRWKLRDSESSSSISKRVKRLINKMFSMLFVSRRGVMFVSWIEDFFAKNLSDNTYYTKLLKEIKPDLVFNSSHIHCKNAYPILHASDKLKLKLATFLFSWDNLTSQGRIIPKYEHYIVWNESIKKDLLEIYRFIKPGQVSVTGTPQFDFHFKKELLWSKEQYFKHIGADIEKPILLYTTGMLNLMPYEEIIVERIADMLIENNISAQLVVRVYPKERSGRFEELKERRKDIVFPHIPWEPNHLTPLPADIELWSNMLYHCSVGINVASTVTLELCIFDKPVINIGYNPYGKDISPKDYALYYTWDHYKPIVDTNSLFIAFNESELPDMIIKALNNPEIKREERAFLIEKFFDGKLDGKAYQRIASVIDSLVN